MLNLTKNVHLRIMYNSLLGWASVNHLHFHCFAFPQELVLDNLPSRDFHGPVRLTDAKYPLPGFLFNVGVEQIGEMTNKIVKVIDILHDHLVAHNVVIVQGDDATFAV